MPRCVRIEYEGAMYHVMSRGDRGEKIFENDRDRNCFLKTVGEACQRSGAVVHSYVLMGNHYHLLLGTPKGNLVKTMQWLQGTYTARFNANHRVRGHLFQGRYKAISVDSEDPTYARVVSDYIHLNPARARLLKGETPALRSYRWSSFPAICEGKAMPVWLDGGSVLSWHHWNIGKSLERREYEQYLQKRALECMDEENRKWQDEEWMSLKRGWFIGGEDFRDRLENIVSGVVGNRKRESYRGDGMRTHDEKEAARFLNLGMECLGLDGETVAAMKKSDERKQALAWLVKSNTVVGDDWVCRTLDMGDRSNISRAMSRFRKKNGKTIVSLIRVLHACTD